MTSVDRVAQAVTKTKKVWLICMTAAVIAFMFSALPLWHGIYLLLFGIFSYFSAVTLTILAQQRSHPTQLQDAQNANNPIFQKLQEDLQSGLLKPGTEEVFQRLRECGMMKILPIGEVSEETVGVFDGHTMYEWVEIQDPITNQMEKFYYNSPGYYEPDGTPHIPDSDVLVYAHVNGVVYAREL